MTGSHTEGRVHPAMSALPLIVAGIIAAGFMTPLRAQTSQAAQTAQTAQTAQQRQAVAATPDTSALRREIEALNRGMEAAINRGAPLEAAAFYADDAVVRTASSVVASGRKGVDDYFRSIGNVRSWKLDVNAVGGTHDQPYQVGRSTLVHGAPERTSVVDFLVIWKRQPDGTLRIVLDYYHSAGR